MPRASDQLTATAPVGGEPLMGAGRREFVRASQMTRRAPRKTCQSVIINLLLILGRALLCRLGTWGGQTCRAVGA
jgi:hypothetical protein